MVTLFVRFVILLLYVEFSKEVEGYNCVDVHHDRQQHHRQDQLLPVVRYWLQDRSQGFETDRDVQQVSGEEEVVIVAENRKREVPQTV